MDFSKDRISDIFQGNGKSQHITEQPKLAQQSGLLNCMLQEADIMASPYHHSVSIPVPNRLANHSSISLQYLPDGLSHVHCRITL